MSALLLLFSALLPFRPLHPPPSTTQKGFVSKINFKRDQGNLSHSYHPSDRLLTLAIQLFLFFYFFIVENYNKNLVLSKKLSILQFKKSKKRVNNRLYSGK